jgi:hypothetical protein
MNTADRLAKAPTKRHLIYDEIEEFPTKTQGPRSLRIRVWMARDATPVVLASQTDPKFNPASMAVQIANWVRPALLRHDENGMLNFEAEYALPCGKWRVTQVIFEGVGHDSRQFLINPVAHEVTLRSLERLVGERIIL